MKIESGNFYCHYELEIDGGEYKRENTGEWSVKSRICCTNMWVGIENNDIEEQLEVAFKVWIDEMNRSTDVE